ncbi:EF-hand calcium-binding domain-containing 10-like [Paramuricea clavata]|uniref:EF-hand calcium-binding domain-containing 10-like n=1 Tax=Paramuricea clavata TaxID=317549 RepID=A0A6S7HX58_PARCT|nr:EF-hand calcium-binding domain-containing 10-like [Paramuricea clavata]
MVSHLKKLMDSRAIEMNHPCLFDDTNIRSLFGILDISNHGYINYEQYKRALENLGIKDINRNPPGADLDEITLEVFLKEARVGLSTSSATFLAT